MDVEALLEAVAGDDPCGDDLSFSREFDAIEECRRADDPTLSQGDWTRPLKAADWAGVSAQCEALLQRRAKDLRLAVWLADAWSRLDGFAGLADGLVLCARLCETWWDHGLHPRPDEGGDASARVGSLDWMLGRVVGAARSAPLLRDGERTFGLHEILAARAPSPSTLRGGAADTASPTADDIARAEAATSAASLASNAVAVRRAIDALVRLEAFIDARLGAEGPSFTAARQALDDALSQVESLARGRVGPAMAPTTAGIGEARAQSTAADVAAGAVENREQALRQLRAVADFFRRTEPHSPVAYLADKAAAWGDMPLHDWLRAVLKDPGALAQMEDLLGVARPAG